VTSYVVLKLSTDERAAWVDVGKYEAASAIAAVKTAAEEHGKGGYIAVPERSWQIHKVTAVQKVTEVKFA
jgi:hypothetical protein